MSTIEEQIEGAQALLLQPSANNVAEAAKRLESAALELAALKHRIEKGRHGAEEVTQHLERISDGMGRVRRLLTNAGRIFNALSGFESNCRYAPQGFLRTDERGGRTLAQL